MGAEGVWILQMGLMKEQRPVGRAFMCVYLLYIANMR